MNGSTNDNSSAAKPLHHREVVVSNELGLHTRPAARIVNLVARAHGPVWIVHADQRAEAASTMDILALGCPPGTSLRLEIENPLDQGLLDTLVRFFENGFKE